MTKMISTIAHRYAGVDLEKFDVFDVQEDRFVDTLIDIGRATLFVEEQPEHQDQEKQKVEVLTKPKQNRKLKLHTVQ